MLIICYDYLMKRFIVNFWYFFFCCFFGWFMLIVLLIFGFGLCLVGIFEVYLKWLLFSLLVDGLLNFLRVVVMGICC